ncbi:50S ribosomal protein L28 [Candidatus Nomurabacteria bacterium]|nr:50S ribosomal protein L28 [Candidatus Nomurabacteria bacterium]
MARICEICQRKAVVGNSRSHSNIASKRTMSINLQSKKIGNERMTICTSCIKSINKEKSKA